MMVGRLSAFLLGFGEFSGRICCCSTSQGVPYGNSPTNFGQFRSRVSLLHHIWGHWGLLRFNNSHFIQRLCFMWWMLEMWKTDSWIQEECNNPSGQTMIYIRIYNIDIIIFHLYNISPEIFGKIRYLLGSPRWVMWASASEGQVIASGRFIALQQRKSVTWKVGKCWGSLLGAKFLRIRL